MKLLLLSSVLLLTSCASTYKNKVIIAHRGAPGYLPEHTLEGVSMAHAWGVDYIEPDLVVTKDNRLVVLHDIHIDTTTDVAKIYPSKKRKDGRYYAVDFTLAQLKKLQLTERVDLKTGKRVFPKRFPFGKSKFEIPTFEEFIELVQGLNQTTGKNIGIYPELKSPEFHTKEKKDIAKLAVRVLDKYKLNETGSKVFIQCFYPPTLKRLKKTFKVKVPLILLIAENDWSESSIDYNYYQTEKGIHEVSEYVDGIGPYMGQLVKYEGSNMKFTNLVSYAHKYKLKVHPYTHRSDSLPMGVKDDKMFFDIVFNQLGVDGIFSDFADKAVEYKNGK